VKDGKVYSFSGNRDLESLLNWVKSDYINSESRPMFSAPGSNACIFYNFEGLFDMIIRMIEDMAKQLFSMLTKHTTSTIAFLGVGFVLGCIFGLLFLVKKGNHGKMGDINPYGEKPKKEKKKVE
jgi:hypothetical protein